MGSSTNTTLDGLPVLGKHDDHQDIGDLPILKKKDAPGAGPTPSPSGSSPKPDPTGQPAGTSGSGSKTVTVNFKNGSLTPDDVADKNGLSDLLPEQISNAVNNKTKNLDRWKNSPSNIASTRLVKEKQDLDGQISKLENTPISVSEYGQEAVDAHRQNIEKLKQKREYVNSQIGKNYDYEKRQLVPKLVDQLKGMVDDSEFDPQTHTLKPVSAQWVLRHVDDIMNKKNNSSVNAAVSGDVDNKERH